MASDTVSTKELEKYIVRAGSFEGPLERLLTLVEDRKLFINEISLAEVTNAYLDFIRQLEQYNIDDMTNFIHIAATLILIKSRSLLPNLTLTEEETSTIIDLEARLNMYKSVRDTGEILHKHYGRRVIHTGLRRLDTRPIFSPDLRLTQKVMLEVLHDVLQKIPAPEKKNPEVSIKKIVSLSEMIEQLTERMTTTISLSFKDISLNSEYTEIKEKKIFTIVSFLALLELVREGIVDVLQNDMFEDMTIHKPTSTI